MSKVLGYSLKRSGITSGYLTETAKRRCVSFTVAGGFAQSQKFLEKSAWESFLTSSNADVLVYATLFI